MPAWITPELRVDWFSMRSRGQRSITATFCRPRRRSAYATAPPTTPPPTIATSTSHVMGATGVSDRHREADASGQARENLVGERVGARRRFGPYHERSEVVEVGPQRRHVRARLRDVEFEQVRLVRAQPAEIRVRDHAAVPAREP